MRVCPNCGHVDPEWWRPAAFHQHIDYADFSVLEIFEEELAEALRDKKSGELVVIEPFVYWKSAKSNTVRRSSVEDFEIKGKSVPQERIDHGDGKDSINLLYVNHPKLRGSASRTNNHDEE